MEKGEANSDASIDTEKNGCRLNLSKELANFIRILW